MLNVEYNRIVVDLTVDSSTALAPRLRAGELDLVIQVEQTDGDDDPSIVSTVLASYPVRWIARSGLIPASRAKHVQTLLHKPVLTFGRGTAPQIAVEAIVAALARRAGVLLADTQVTRMPSVAVIVKLLRDGYGIAAVPALFVEPFLSSGELGQLQVRPLPPPITVAMYYRDDADVSVLAASRVTRCAQRLRSVCVDDGTAIDRAAVIYFAIARRTRDAAARSRSDCRTRMCSRPARLCPESSRARCPSAPGRAALRPARGRPFPASR
jgi:DNA-binding transcriptional LysR family regulator